MNHRISGLVLMAFLAGIPQASANRFNTETSSSVRALGMGNAAINSERGPYAVFYNPANIAAKNTGTNIQLLNLKLDMNDPGLSQLSQFGSPLTQDLSSLYQKLDSDRGEYLATGYSLFPNITIRNLSIGVLYEFNQGAEVRETDGALRVKARNRLAPTAALSFRLLNGMLRLGYSAQYLTVGDSDQWVLPPIDASTLDFGTYINNQAGWVHTAGATLTLPIRNLPSFSVVARNMMGTRFNKQPLLDFGDRKEPFFVPMTYDAAASAVIYMGKRLELIPEVNYRDVTQKMGGSQLQRIFAGAELKMFEFLKLRGGVMHGYWSAGLGIYTRKGTLDLAAYADEREERLRTAKDQRYVLQYTWGLFR